MLAESTEATKVSKIRRKKGQITKRQGAEVVKTTSGKASYAKLTTDNRKWVAQKCVETGHSATAIVNHALEAIRTGKKFNLEVYEPKYLKRAMEARQNRVARLKKIASA